MKLAMMQPYFFPYLGYFQLINAVDKYILYDNVYFTKNGWINRNRILEKNKGEILITMPLKNKSHLKKIYEVLIDDSQPWRKKVLKSLQNNYNKAPMFHAAFPLLEYLISYNTDNLSEYNINSIKEICNYLEIKTEIITDRKKYLSIEDNLKETTNEKILSETDETINSKTKRILDVCSYEKADIYINAIGGKELYSKEIFSQNYIELFFIQSSQTYYKQYENEFIPWLSIIDVLMFNPREHIRHLLNEYTLL
jgi:hypothetical protein